MHPLRDTAKARWWAFIVIALMSFAARAASPHERSWRLLYSRAAAAPSNCPDEEYLRKSLAAKLDGHAPFTNDASHSISVDIQPTASDVEAHIVARDENGNATTNETLRVEAWRCDLLGERIVFVLQDIVAPLEAPNANAQTAPHASSADTKPPKKDKTPVSIPVEKTPPKRKPSSQIPKLGLSAAVGPACV